MKHESSRAQGGRDDCGRGPFVDPAVVGVRELASTSTVPVSSRGNASREEPSRDQCLANVIKLAAPGLRRIAFHPTWVCPQRAHVPHPGPEFD